MPAVWTHTSWFRVTHFWHQVQWPFPVDSREQCFKVRKPHGVFLSLSSWSIAETFLITRRTTGSSARLILINELHFGFLVHFQSPLSQCWPNLSSRPGNLHPAPSDISDCVSSVVIIGLKELDLGWSWWSSCRQVWGPMEERWEWNFWAFRRERQDLVWSV